MTYRCLIIDDEQLARQLLEGYVSRIPNLELAASCKNPIDGLDIMQNESIDIVFLDIQMPEMLGTEFVKSLLTRPAIIFTSAYRDYAIEGFELDIVDYILKPISFERFLQSFNKATDRLQIARGKSVKSEAEFITVKANHRIYKINYDDLIYIEGLGEYVALYCKNRKVVALESLKNLESMLPSSLFIRSHRSYIVNKAEIISLYGNQIEIQDNLLPIGKSYRQTMHDYFSALG